MEVKLSSIYTSIVSLIIVLFIATASFADLDEPLGSAELITKAYESGEIDTQTYAIQKLRAYFAPETVDPAFKTSVLGPTWPKREHTILFHIAKQYYDLYGEEDKEFLIVIFKRPTGLDKSYETTNFKFHYTTAGADAVPTTDADGDGIPDYVKTMAEEFENVYDVETGEYYGKLGYDKPPKDPGDDAHGGNDKFDVYIRDTCKAGSCDYGIEQGEAKAASGDGNEYYSYLQMENDFADNECGGNHDQPCFKDSVQGYIQVTAAHEFHHAIQDGYNGDFYGTWSWIYESTSTWIEDQVYDSVDDNLQYVNDQDDSAFFYNPEKSLDDKSGTHQYGVWIWHEFLETKWDKAAIKKVWEELDPPGKDDPIVATTTMLNSKGSSLKDAFTGFVAKNYSQEGFYKDADKYDEVPPFPDSPHTLDYSNATSMDWQEKQVNHLAAKYYKFIPGPFNTEQTTLSIEVDGVDGKDVNAIAIVKKEDGSYDDAPFSLNNKKEGKVIISDFSSEKITEVMLALVNYSKADNDLEVKYRASLSESQERFMLSWAATYGEVDISEDANSIQQTSDGGYVVTGHKDALKGEIWVLKLDPEGDVQWQKAYGSVDSYEAYSIQQTSDGGYIVTGSIWSSGDNQSDMWVLKLDPGGNVQWQKSYSKSVEVNAIQQTSDGGYIVAGWSYELTPYALVLKLSGNGSIEWQKQYGLDNSKAYSIQQTNDGGYIVGADSRGAHFIFKIDSGGNYQWGKTYGDVGGQINSIQQTNDGGYVAAGANGNVLKLDSVGSIQWQKNYGGDVVVEIQQTEDSGYALLIRKYLDGFEFDVLMLDSIGNVKWENHYGGTGDEWPGSIQVTSDGGCILAGMAKSFGDIYGDIWVLKLMPAQEGSVPPSCDFVKDITPTWGNTFATAYDLADWSEKTDATPQSTAATPMDTNVTAGVICRATTTDIEVNDSDVPVTVAYGTNLTVTASLDPGNHTGENADWWVYATTSFGTYWYTSDSSWQPSDTPIRTYGGPLFSLAPYTILNMSTLPTGNYVFNFEVDGNMDGVKDGTYTDSVEVTIE